MLAAINVNGQPWARNDAIFNPSGIPSLPFSQPRFADLDGDGDNDLCIGSIDNSPIYMENTGSASLAHFIPGDNIFSMVASLDAEMGVSKDIDADGDLDFITGGFTGLNVYENTGTSNNPVFVKVEGYFTGLDVGQSPVPDFADIDNDGDPDMVVGLSESGLVKLYTNTGTPASGIFSENSMYEIADVGLYAYPTFCDLDDDSDQDLVIGRDGLGIWYYKNNGTPELADWQIDMTVFAGIAMEAYFNSPGLTDLDGDGTFDLVFGNADGPLKYFVNTGTPNIPVWEENISLFGGVLDPGGASNPYLFDFDADGDLDLFTGSQIGDIKYYKNTGTVTGPAWEENSEYFTSLKHSIYSAVAVGDVNADGLPDAIVGDLSGKLYYHRNTGFGFTLVEAALQSVALGGWSAPRLVDFDSDGDFDIIAGSENGKLNYIENQGSAGNPVWVLISAYFGSLDVGSNCVPAIADLDYDGDLDMLCGTMFGDIIWFENQNGSWVENLSMIFGIIGEQNASPSFGDLDGDGDQDLVLGEYSGVFSYYRNQYLIIGIPANQQSDIHPAVFPNPCSTESASIQFTLPHETTVMIQIVNISGQVVKEQHLGLLPSGFQTIDLNTNTWPDGAYFIRIQTPESCNVIKIMRQ
jgi:hypothetical protein